MAVERDAIGLACLYEDDALLVTPDGDTLRGVMATSKIL